MKRQYLKYALVVALASLALSPLAMGELRKWNQKMQELAKTFSDLVPELSDAKPITPSSHRKLEKGTKKLLELVHTINMGPDTKGNPLPPESDLSIGFISNLLEREVKHAYAALKTGHTAYAKAVLRTTTGYCIACHSRHDKGPDFPKSGLSAKAEAALSPMERAELLAATRQFDAALEEFEKIATDPSLARTNAIQWGKAIKHALNLSVRVKKDADRTLSFLDKVLALPQISGFYAAHLPIWRQDVLEWKNEGPKSLDTEAALFAEAKRLSELAQGKQRYPIDHAADVVYLRSSAVLHEQLSRFPHGKLASEALFLAGSAYDLLQDRLTTPLPELYYEACVRNTPHTKIAAECFQRLEQDVLFGYTGSAGTFLPADVQSALNELRELSKPKKP